MISARPPSPGEARTAHRVREGQISLDARESIAEVRQSMGLVTLSPYNASALVLRQVSCSRRHIESVKAYTTST